MTKLSTPRGEKQETRREETTGSGEREGLVAVALESAEKLREDYRTTVMKASKELAVG